MEMKLRRVGFVFLLLMLIQLSALAQEVILVVHPVGSAFKQVQKGLVDGLSDEMRVQELVIGRETKVDELIKSIDKVKPRAVVLMDNTAIYLFKEYRQKGGDSAQALPAVAVIGVEIENAILGMNNIRGIAYEIPAITSLVNLRSFSKKNITTVGVVYRSFMASSIAMNDDLCKNEQFSLKTVALKNDGDSVYYLQSMKKALDTLLNQNKVDVMWIPLDNKLLTTDIITKVWIPRMSSRKTPAIVCMEKLAKPEYNFGTFALVPDHEALGGQVTGMLFTLKNSGWRYSDSITVKVEQPITVYKALNVEQARKYLGVKEDFLKEVDSLLE